MTEITIEYLQTARFDNGEFSLRVDDVPPSYGVDTQAEPVGFDALADAGSRAARTAHSRRARSARRSRGSRRRPPARPVSAGTGDAGDPARSAAPLEASIHVALAPGFLLVDVVTRGPSRADAGRDVYRIETVTPRAPMDHDLVTVASGRRPEADGRCVVRDGRRHDLRAADAAAAKRTGWRTQPRELICVVDTSGSMAGQSISQAKTALANALDRPPPPNASM